ncbi:MAG: hypothetical protein P8Y36_02280, partial [Alphaproteobacteria bacterium]
MAGKTSNPPHPEISQQLSEAAEAVAEARDTADNATNTALDEELKAHRLHDYTPTDNAPSAPSTNTLTNIHFGSREHIDFQESLQNDVTGPYTASDVGEFAHQKLQSGAEEIQQQQSGHNLPDWQIPNAVNPADAPSSTPQFTQRPQQSEFFTPEIEGQIDKATSVAENATGRAAEIMGQHAEPMQFQGAPRTTSELFPGRHETSNDDTTPVDYWSETPEGHDGTDTPPPDPNPAPEPENG